MPGALRTNSSALKQKSNFNGLYSIQEAVAFIVDIVDNDGGNYYTKEVAIRANRKSTGQLLYSAMCANLPPERDPSSHKLIIGEYIYSVIKYGAKSSAYPSLFNSRIPKSIFDEVNKNGHYKVNGEDIPIIMSVFLKETSSAYLCGDKNKTLKDWAQKLVTLGKVTPAPSVPAINQQTNTNQSSTISIATDTVFPKKPEETKFVYNLKFIAVERGVPYFSTKEGDLCVLIPSPRTPGGDFGDISCTFGNFRIQLGGCFKINTNKKPRVIDHPILNKKIPVISDYNFISFLGRVS